MEDGTVEIYRQRYETFRHLDRIRWQMLQLLVAVASATALVLRSTHGNIDSWFYCLLGVALVVISFVMFRVAAGIRRNSQILKKVAEKLGDNGIPDVSNPWRSFAHWLALSICVTGALLIVAPVYIAVFH